MALGTLSFEMVIGLVRTVTPLAIDCPSSLVIEIYSSPTGGAVATGTLPGEVIIRFIVTVAARTIHGACCTVVECGVPPVARVVTVRTLL
jgi:hypothetical protein